VITLETVLTRRPSPDVLRVAPNYARPSKRARIVVFSTCLLFLSEAQALGTFSRACRFDQIPNGLQTIAATFFTLLGAPSWVRDLPNHQQKDRYWILESITTDYTSTQYYLGARHTVYQWHQGNYAGWLSKLTRDSGLARDQLDPSVLTDDKFRIFTKNRGLLFSARAGSAEIVERTDNIAGANPLFNRWRVVGHHYYYDPRTRRNFVLTGSVAEDCNLSEGWPRP
jgi:hypothetical protein